MANKWFRILSGILTGGLSEIPIAVYDKAKNSKDGPVQAKKTIDEMIAESGLSEAEFFQLHPELQQEYFESQKYGDGLVADAITNFGDNNIFEKTKDAYKGSKLEENIDKLTENVTGDRDIAENQKNRSFQAEQAQIARDWEAEQARVAREWDSIGAQMERAAAAGVNPISIAMQNGGINASATTSIPSAPAYPSGSAGLMHNGALDIASMIFNGIGTLAENRLKQTQADDIVIMRDYNIAESMATVDHLRKLDSQIELSNVSQSIQNKWLDVMQQVTYDGMLLQNGVSRETILEKRSIQRLNLTQVDSIRQSMEINLKEFNAKLPLELQLMESQIDINKMSVQDLYTEICLRYLQSIEQENRNRQSAAEAGSAEVAEFIAKNTYEEQIAAFHNNMVKSAAEAGVSLYDYMYYGNNYKGFFDWMGKTERAMFKNRKRREKSLSDVRSSLIIPQNVPSY